MKDRLTMWFLLVIISLDTTSIVTVWFLQNMITMSMGWWLIVIVTIKLGILITALIGPKDDKLPLKQ